MKLALSAVSALANSVPSMFWSVMDEVAAYRAFAAIFPAVRFVAVVEPKVLDPVMFKFPPVMVPETVVLPAVTEVALVFPATKLPIVVDPKVEDAAV